MKIALTSCIDLHLSSMNPVTIEHLPRDQNPLLTSVVTRSGIIPLRTYQVICYNQNKIKTREKRPEEDCKEEVHTFIYTIKNQKDLLLKELTIYGN